MPILISSALTVQGPPVAPYQGEWQLLTRQRYPEAEIAWDDAQLFECDAAKSGDPLSIDEALVLEQMIREQVLAEGGGPLETLIYYRVERTPGGEAQVAYKVYHAAHGSPIAWAVIIAFIAANWKAILITLGLLAAATMITTFVIKGSQIIWHAGQVIDDVIEPLAPVILGVGAGILILLLLTQLGKKKE